MSATNKNGRASNSIVNLLRSFCGAGKPRRRPSVQSKNGRSLRIEGLENREMFSVSSLYLSGNALVVHSNTGGTTVKVNQVGSNIRISDVGTNRTWDYAASQVGRVDFVGGAGSDRFVNYVTNLPVRAWGMGGNDYLEGYNGADTFVGGDGHDTLVGYGGNDQMWGGNGDDVLRGMIGNDVLRGEAGNDHLDGGANDDIVTGGDGSDILLGGADADQLIGGYGSDRLNGQAGIDKMWGEADNDVLIAIDAVYNELVDGGDGADIMWIDGYLSGFFAPLRDTVISASTSDVVQRVSSFANGADKTLNGDNITDPTTTEFRQWGTVIGLDNDPPADLSKLRYNNIVTAGNTQGSNPLFSRDSSIVFDTNRFSSGDGPRSSDIEQGNVGDCSILAGLGAIANQDRNIIRQNVVDFDDGTYGVRLGDKFYRVDNELPVWNTSYGAASWNLKFADLGAQNSMWVAVVEKAFAHYHLDANTYASLNGSWSTDVFKAFRMDNIFRYKLSAYTSAATMAADMYTKWTQGFAMTVDGIANNGPDGGSHSFTVERFVRNAAGIVTDVVLRNPWAYDGLSSFNSLASANPGPSQLDGVFSLTVNQLFNCGADLCIGQV